MDPKIRLSIGTKLIALLAFLLIGSLISVVSLSMHLYIKDNTALIQQMNADIAVNLSDRTAQFLEAIGEKSRILGGLAFQTKQSEQMANDLLQGHDELKGLLVIKKNKDALEVSQRLYSQAILELGNPEVLERRLLGKEQFSWASGFSGEFQINWIDYGNSNSLVALYPFAKTKADSTYQTLLLAILKMEDFQKIYKESEIASTLLVDRKGRVLAFSPNWMGKLGDSISHHEITQRLMEGKFHNGQTRYLDPDSNEPKLGAFRQVGVGGLGVVAVVPEQKAFAAANRVAYRSLLVAFAVLCLAFLAGYLYSTSLTWPIKVLVQATTRIARGEFNLQLKSYSKDELGHLSLAFNSMAKGLEEREKVKEVFNKFHNKEIVEKLLSGEVKLGGERRTAVIFFSDIRGFTALSSRLDPQNMVEMLNEYMTEMVAVIRAHNGVVDKYVGDAIMAIWGTPVGREDDAYQAIRACLAIRQKLNELNERRIQRGDPALYIGMGLNLGEVIAGNIGSQEKMEYTVIGDSVNTASRIESLTKELGTDLLVSDSLVKSVGEKFLLEACELQRVKGIESALQVYKVHGYKDENGVDVLVKTPYSQYAQEKSDKVVHAA